MHILKIWRLPGCREQGWFFSCLRLVSAVPWAVLTWESHFLSGCACCLISNSDHLSCATTSPAQPQGVTKLSKHFHGCFQWDNVFATALKTLLCKCRIVIDLEKNRWTYYLITSNVALCPWALLLRALLSFSNGYSFAREQEFETENWQLLFDEI